jgi:hypothetical protein
MAAHRCYNRRARQLSRLPQLQLEIFSLCLGLGPVIMIISGALIAPFAITVLPVKTYIQYSTALNFQQPALENWKLGPLPQTSLQRTTC